LCNRLRKIVVFTLALLILWILPDRADAKTTTVKFGTEIVLLPNGQASAPQGLNIQNRNAGAITVTKLTTSNSEFAIQPNNCVGSYQPGQACQFLIVFMPRAVGKRTGTVTANTSAGTLAANLTGQGKLGQVSLSVRQLNFGNVQSGSLHSESLVVTNRNPVALPPASISISGPPFSIVSNTCAAGAPANDRCSVSVQFFSNGPVKAKGELLLSDSALRNQSRLGWSEKAPAPQFQLQPVRIRRCQLSQRRRQPLRLQLYRQPRRPALPQRLTRVALA
jgi:hypothetical protein